MSDMTEQALTQAYELIEEDKLTDAEAILKPLLEQDADNVDAWWLYAHAVSDPETARMALNQVLRLDNSYEGAEDLVGKLQKAYPSDEPVEPVMSFEPPPTLPNLPEDEDIESPDFLSDEEDMAAVTERASSGLDEDFSLDDLDDDFEFAQAGGRRFPVGVILLALLLVVIVIAAVIILNPFAATAPAATPTIVQQAAAVSPTPQADDATPTMEEAVPTSAPVESTAEPTSSSDEDQAVLDALSALDVVEGTLNTSETQLGHTLLVGVCTTGGAAMRETLSEAMDALAGVSTSIDADAVGVILIDCTNNNSTLRVIAVPVADGQAYASGELSEMDFQSRWVAVA